MIRKLALVSVILAVNAATAIVSRPIPCWAIDVTLVKDLWIGNLNSYPQELTVMDGTLYFVATTEVGRELWKSNGTAVGTLLVKDVFPGPGDSSPSEITVSRGKLFFYAFDGPAYESELWVSDGTPAGTVKLDINPTGASDPAYLTDMGGILYFSAYEPTFGRELWRSDGTPAGTYVVKNMNATGDSNPAYLTVNGNRLYFSADVLFPPGPEFCISDGTGPGTNLLSGVSYASNLTIVGPRVFFQGTVGGDTELYVSDGTPAGTVLVKNINPAGGSFPRDMGAFGNILLFSADDGIGGYELWRSDGTADGTVLIKDINPSGSSWPRGFITESGVSLFSAIEPNTNRELWRTDGTLNGTVLVKDIRPGLLGWVEPRFSSFAGHTYFDADNGINGNELWRTDGTAAGTAMVCDLEPGGGSSWPLELTVLGNVLYFNAHVDGVGHELWRYDPVPTPAAGPLPRFTLAQNYPNPFNPATTIEFELDKPQLVTLSVYDVEGKLVRVLVDRTMSAGPHRETWNGQNNDGQDLASGVYFLQLRTPNRTLVRKAVLVK